MAPGFSQLAVECVSNLIKNFIILQTNLQVERIASVSGSNNR